MIDFHSHILYGIDDGAKDESMALEMLKIAVDSGTKKIVATPHYVRGRFQIPRGEIKKKVEELRKVAVNNNIDLEIYEGQEVYYTRNLMEYYEEGLIDTIEGTRYMLVELPMREFNTEEVLDTLYEFQIKGIVIILAHPERYKVFIKEPFRINKFIEEGFLFQLNTGSLSGEFGKEVEKTAEIFVKNKIYSVIGSDGHRTEGRNTDLRKGIDKLKKITSGYIEEIEENSKRVLRDEEITFKGKKVEKKKGLLDFFRLK